MRPTLTSNLIIVATLVITLYLSPTLIGSSFSQPGLFNETDGSNLAMFDDALVNQTSAPENNSDSGSQENDQQGNFCLKGTGPGTDNPCIPCTPTTSSSPGESLLFSCALVWFSTASSNISVIDSSTPSDGPVVAKELPISAGFKYNAATNATTIIKLLAMMGFITNQYINVYLSFLYLQLSK